MQDIAEEPGSLDVQMKVQEWLDEQKETRQRAQLQHISQRGRSSKDGELLSCYQAGRPSLEMLGYSTWAILVGSEPRLPPSSKTFAAKGRSQKTDKA